MRLGFSPCQLGVLCVSAVSFLVAAVPLQTAKGKSLCLREGFLPAAKIESRDKSAVGSKNLTWRWMYQLTTACCLLLASMPDLSRHGG